jgi:hypothetical protein
MGRSRLDDSKRRYFATAVVAAVIIYGSIYPFVFREPIDGFGGAVRTLVESWADRPSRSDFIANILLYMPFGFCAILAAGKGVGTLRWMALVILCGALLSTCVELVQYFDEGRVTSASDVYANSIGTALGAIGGGVTGRNFRWPLLREIAAHRVPNLLLSAWVGYRLFPYVPTIDPHKYWTALKPVLLHPSLTGYDLFRYTAIWLTVAALVEVVGGSRRLWPLFSLFVGFVLVGKVLIVDTTLSAAEIAGAAAAVCVWRVLAFNARLRVKLIALAFCSYVIAERLEPFQFRAVAGTFGWIPFFGFMFGSIEIDIMSFFQKFFLYGGLIWLLCQCGLRLRWSTVVTATILFVAGEAEMYLPDRSGQITDAVLALMIGTIFALLETTTERSQPVVVGPGGSLPVTAGGWRPKESAPETRSIAPNRARGGLQVSKRPVEPRFREIGRTGRGSAFVRLVIATICLSGAAFIAANYPLAPWLLGAALALYAVALWRWPSLWLAVLPALLPTLDLAPWTGWIDVGEPDLFALVTIGVLAVRAPPRAADFRFRGLAAMTLALAIVSCVASVALGLVMPGPAGGSDNPYLRPDNALRIAKGFVTALALLPFLRERLSRRGDAMVWLGGGMAAGLALVAAATIIERALFPGLFDFSADYRVVATFSSMHIGGGYIGAYIAMALPFLLVFMLRLRTLSLISMLAIELCAGYALVVTFARTAYAAGLISTIAVCLGWAWAGRGHNRGGRFSLVLPALLVVPVGGIVIAGVATPFTAERVNQVFPDLASWEDNWREGLAWRGSGPITALFGSGLGTYPRVVLARKPDDGFPTNFVVAQDGGYRFLRLNAGSPTYFGQKIRIEPDRQYRIFLALRSRDGQGALAVSLCEKMLLYAEHCRGVTFRPRVIGKWEDFGAAISSEGLDGHRFLGWFSRPVELSLADPDPGTTIEIGHVRMFDPQNRNVLANGDFSRGTERWYFTDDDHSVWRTFNQYLMSYAESGVLGLASFLLLVGTALFGAARAIRCGERMAACIAASLLAFLCSGLFDHLLAVPRLATLFYLIAFCGLIMLSRAPDEDRGFGTT